MQQDHKTLLRNDLIFSHQQGEKKTVFWFENQCKTCTCTISVSNLILGAAFTKQTSFYLRCPVYSNDLFLSAAYMTILIREDKWSRMAIKLAKPYAKCWGVCRFCEPRTHIGTFFFGPLFNILGNVSFCFCQWVITAFQALLIIRLRFSCAVYLETHWESPQMMLIARKCQHCWIQWGLFSMSKSPRSPWSSRKTLTSYLSSKKRSVTFLFDKQRTLVR